MEVSLVLFYKGEKDKLPARLNPDGIYYTTDEKHLYILGTEFIDKDSVLDLRMTVDKSEYEKYILINENNPNYNKIIFLSDGSGIIHKGLLYTNSPFWFKIVDDEPDIKEKNTVYLIKE